MSNKITVRSSKNLEFRNATRHIRRDLGPTLLRAADIKDARALASKLMHPSEPVSQHVHNELSEEAKSQLERAAKMPPEELQTLLASEMNRLIVDLPLNSEQIQETVKPSSDTRQMLAQQASDDRRILLNRKLLEHAFPDEVEFHPYVGPRPFSADDQSLFFGRDHEVRDLVGLITAHETVLLYAQSGSGKTSLLNAALIPALEEDLFEVLPPARVRGSVPSELDPDEITNIYAFNVLVSWSEEDADVASLQKLTIAEYLDGLERAVDEYEEPLARVVVFDQFEELFTSYPDRWREREEFFEQVIEAIEEDPSLRVLFVMREDFVADMDPYASRLPDRLRIRYHMERMRQQESLRAVKDPLRGSGRSFDDNAANQLVMELLQMRVEDASGKAVVAPGEFVEPVQLQVVCQTLWDDLPPETRIITKDHVRESGNIDHALTAFYEKCLETSTRKSGVGETQLREWFECELITPAGTRGTVYRGAESTKGIPNDAIDILENQHLIRAEVRGGSRWYELTHDRFIAPIQKANEEWRHNTYSKEVLTLQDMTRLWRITSAIVFAAAVVLAIAASIGWYQAAKAERAAKALSSRFMRKEGALHLERGDVSGALLWFVDDLRDQSRPELKRLADLNRLRIGAGLHQQPTLAAFIHRASPAAISFSPEGRYLVIGHKGTASGTLEGAPAVVELWDLQDRQAEKGVPLPLPNADNRAVVCAAFSPDDRFLAVGTRVRNDVDHPEPARPSSENETGEVYIFELNQRPALYRSLAFKQGAVTDVAFRPRNARDAHLNRGNEFILGLVLGGQTFLWPVGEDDKRQPEPLHEGGVSKHVRFSPDGNYVAVAMTNNQDSKHEVLMWDVDTLLTENSPDPAQQRRPDSDEEQGREAAYSFAFETTINQIAFSPTENLMAVAVGNESAGSAVLLRWVDNRNQNAPFHSLGLVQSVDHDKTVRDVAFSPDGRFVATASDDQTAKVRELQSRTDRTLPHNGTVFQAKFSADARYVATGSRDQQARIWSLETFEPVLAPMYHSGSVTTVEFSPNTFRLLTHSENTVRVWDLDVKNNRPVALMSEGELKKHFYDSELQFVMTASDRTGEAGSIAQVWNATNGKPHGERLPHVGPITAAAVDNQNGRVATVTTSNGGAVPESVFIWDIATSTRRDLGRLPFDVVGVHDMLFSPDGKLLVAACRTVANHGSTSGDHGATIVWDTSTGNQEEPFTHHAPAEKLCYSDDGKFVAVVDGDGNGPFWIYVLDARTAEPVAGPFEHDESVLHLEFDKNSHLLITACEDDRARIWDLKDKNNRQPRCTLQQPGWVRTHTANVNLAAFSPVDDRLVVTVGEDRRAKLWKLNESRNKATLQHELEHAEPVYFAAFSHPISNTALPNHHLLVTSSGRAIRVWDVKDGELVVAFQNPGNVEVARFAPDNQSIRSLSLQRGGISSNHVVVATWNLAPDQRDARRLQKIAELLGARRADRSKIALATIKDITEWDRLDGKLVDPHKRKPVLPTKEVSKKLHQRMAFDALTQANVFAADWHIEEASRTTDSTDGELVELRRGLAQLRKTLNLAESSEKRNEKLSDLENRGRDFLSSDENEVAAQEFSKVLEQTPDSVESLVGRATAFNRLGRRDEALDDYWKAIALTPNDQNLWIEIASIYRNESRTAFRNSQMLDRALVDFPEVATRYPDRLQAQYLLGHAYYESGQWRLAEEQYSRVVEMLNTDWIRYWRAAAYLEQADERDKRGEAQAAFDLRQQAVDDLKQNVVSRPMNVDKLALAMIASGQEQAYRELCASLLDSDNDANSNNIAWTCALRPDSVTDFRNPLQRAEDAVEETGTYYAMNTLGVLQYRAAELAIGKIPREEAEAQFKKSIDQLEKSIETRKNAKVPESASWYDWLFLAMAHHHLGNDEQASTWYAKTKTLGKSPSEDWYARFEKEMLAKEAEQLLAGTAK